MRRFAWISPLVYWETLAWLRWLRDEVRSTQGAARILTPIGIVSLFMRLPEAWVVVQQTTPAYRIGMFAVGYAASSLGCFVFVGAVLRDQRKFERPREPLASHGAVRTAVLDMRLSALRRWVAAGCVVAASVFAPVGLGASPGAAGAVVMVAANAMWFSLIASWAMLWHARHLDLASTSRDTFKMWRSTVLEVAMAGAPLWLLLLGSNRLSVLETLGSQVSLVWQVSMWPLLLLLPLDGVRIAVVGVAALVSVLGVRAGRRRIAHWVTMHDSASTSPEAPQSAVYANAFARRRIWLMPARPWQLVLLKDWLVLWRESPNRRAFAIAVFLFAPLGLSLTRVMIGGRPEAGRVLMGVSVTTVALVALLAARFTLTCLGAEGRMRFVLSRAIGPAVLLSAKMLARVVPMLLVGAGAGGLVVGAAALLWPAAGLSAGVVLQASAGIAVAGGALAVLGTGVGFLLPEYASQHRVGPVGASPTGALLYLIGSAVCSGPLSIGTALVAQRTPATMMGGVIALALGVLLATALGLGCGWLAVRRGIVAEDA